MKVAVILPARLASSRLPEKLLLDRSGKSVLEHTIDRAKEAQAASHGLIKKIIVAADAPQLLAIAENAGVTATQTDVNHTSGTDRIAEAAKALDADIIVNLQADEPEIDPKNILKVAELLLAKNETAQMSTLAVPIYNREKWLKPNVTKVVVNNTWKALYFSRQPIPFVRDGDPNEPAWEIDGKKAFGLHHLGIYAYRRIFLLRYKALPASRLEQLEKLEQLRALDAGHEIKVGLAGDNPPGIDTPEDYEAFLVRIQRR